MLDDVVLQRSAAQLGQNLLARGWRVATAESCTGGGIGCALTTVAGSSMWFEGGIIAYSNQVKQRYLDVSASTLQQMGAVSEAVVVQMAQAARRHFAVDIAVAVSGIAGPGGAQCGKPVGCVCFAWALAEHALSETAYFQGDREMVRWQTVYHALLGLLKCSENKVNE